MVPHREEAVVQIPATQLGDRDGNKPGNKRRAQGTYSFARGRASLQVEENLLLCCNVVPSVCPACPSASWAPDISSGNSSGQAFQLAASVLPQMVIVAEPAEISLLTRRSGPLCLESPRPLIRCAGDLRLTGVASNRVRELDMTYYSPITSSTSGNPRQAHTVQRGTDRALEHLDGDGAGLGKPGTCATVD